MCGRLARSTVLVIAAVRLFYKELLFYTFDPSGAEALGLPVNAINFGLMAAITLTIIAGMKTVGVILVVALYGWPRRHRLPGWSKNCTGMMILGAMLGALFGIIGMYSSYYLDIPSGPAIGANRILRDFCWPCCSAPRQGILTRSRAGQNAGKST